MKVIERKRRVNTIKENDNQDVNKGAFSCESLSYVADHKSTTFKPFMLQVTMQFIRAVSPAHNFPLKDIFTTANSDNIYQNTVNFAVSPTCWDLSSTTLSK